MTRPKTSDPVEHWCFTLLLHHVATSIATIPITLLPMAIPIMAVGTAIILSTKFLRPI